MFKCVCLLFINTLIIVILYTYNNNCCIKMTQIETFLKIFKQWRQEDGKSIINVLTRINQTKSFKGQDLDDIYKGITEFHKQIGKADQNDVDPIWFEHTINLKKKLKKMIDLKQKQKLKPKLQKKESNVVRFPEQLLVDRGPIQQENLKSLYKNFFTNYKQTQEYIPLAVTFLRNLMREIKYMLQDKPENEMIKRVSSIAIRLSRQSSKEAKDKMLIGSIKPSQLAENNEELYLDEKAKQSILQLQRAKVQESLCGFYDDMKKKINSDAHERCVFCHKQKAFCQDMKQIRASDEPMTRFMRCNACGKAWRD